MAFWVEALLMVVHIINMSPSKPLGYKIPQELWFGKTLDYIKLQIFRCEMPKDECWKLDSWPRKCILLGYGPDGSFGYWLWDLEN